MLAAYLCRYASVYHRGVHTDIPDFSMPAEEEAQLAAESFRLLADPIRIKILWALLQGESSVACLGDLVGANPTVVSQHLAKLRLAGLVKGRREGTFMFYKAADVHVRRLLAEALFHAEHADDGGTEDEGGHRHRKPVRGRTPPVATRSDDRPHGESRPG